MTGVSIVVPSYRRPERLARCLAALDAQRPRADEVLVVCRADDAATRSVLAGSPSARRIDVSASGVLHAMRAGARAARNELIGFVDDDAEPRPGWLAGTLERLADPTVGGVGGRDLVDPHPQHRPKRDVGRITPLGKLVGDHHLGTGQARDVDVLKAADMVFRRQALALPDGLRGDGAQMHFEIATCLWAIARGWRLVYDPDLVVDHLAGPRFDDDARGVQSARAARNAAFNLVLCVGALRPELLRRRLLFGLLIGDQGGPGVVRAGVALARRESEVARRFWPSVTGHVAAYRRLRSSGELTLYTYPEPGVEVAVSSGSRRATPEEAPG